MFVSMSLRFRIFLFFALIALAGVALAAGALAFGWSRGEAALPAGPFVTAFVMFGFLNTGVVLGIWLLFDENVAKPIDMLSAKLRQSAHSEGATTLDEGEARYLGDLAPAALALAQTADASVTDMATRIARETERLKGETEKLTAVLTEAPVATILLNKAMEIVLYDAQAADVISKIAHPRLRAPIGDYFNTDVIAAALSKLGGKKGEVPATLRDAGDTQSFEARIKRLSNDGYMIFFDPDDAPEARAEQRPLVFDFGLIDAGGTADIEDKPLSDFCFVVFDTETTGLSVERDDIVQIGAVRVLNGRIVEGEVFDSYVDPGRPIPPAATRIHHVSDADVVGAPDIGRAAGAFHHFARDAVLVAHNAPFDIGLLRRHEAKLGLDWSHPVLDTVLLSAVLFGTTEDHSLDALCARFSVDLPDELRHTALGDARATAEVLVRLLPILEGRGLRTFAQVIEETRRHGRLLEDLNG
ncbi:MAG: 3'-5' exonuclease [Silicimonas sp.]|nr:3'-5' exonuclease [Silicimonas sp.]